MSIAQNNNKSFAADDCVTGAQNKIGLNRVQSSVMYRECEGTGRTYSASGINIHVGDQRIGESVQWSLAGTPIPALFNQQQLELGYQAYVASDKVKRHHTFLAEWRTKEPLFVDYQDMRVGRSESPNVTIKLERQQKKKNPEFLRSNL